MRLKLVQFSSVAQSCPTLSDLKDYSMPCLPAHHYLPVYLTISLDAIITYYNKLRGTGNSNNGDWFAEYVLFHVEYGKNEGENDTNPNDDTAAYQHSKLTFTISDFKLVK